MEGLSGPLTEVKDPVVDIVFVHGLNGNREKTWSKYNIFWPRDLIPADIEQAQTFTWGYNAKVANFWHNATENDLSSHSSNLLSDLAGSTKSTGAARPIIFVVHSLGGLVCVNALISAQNSADLHLKDVVARTRGIIFLGTPHEGSSKTKWITSGQKFFKYAGVNFNDMYKDLEKGSYKLAQLATAFQNFIRSRRESKDPGKLLEVMCFYEEYETSGIGLIVPQQSAMITGYESQSIPADHQEMCKFASKSDVGYERVSRVLNRWIDELKNPDEEKAPNGDSIHTVAKIGGDNLGQFVVLNKGGSLQGTFSHTINKK